MPNRFIRESCRTSPTLARLSHGGERLFWRLTTVADDYGRFEAIPMVVLGQCFPRMLDKITVKDVGKWLSEILEAGLIRAYVEGPKVYGEFLTWGRHQGAPRAKASRHPDPTENRMLAFANICSQMQANVPVFVSVSVFVSESVSEDRIRGSADPANISMQDFRGTGARRSPEGDDAPEVLEWLNKKTGKTFRPVEANLSLIRARLADGVHIWQLKAIVSRKTREWAGDPKMAKYLRPETLFNKTKCEQYLGELPPVTEVADAD